MDRSQLRKLGIWLISLCLIISPFWSASEAVSGDSLETTFNTLDENVQNELVFKRLMIEAIDTSLEINSALGFDSSSTFQRAAVLVPAYAVVRGTYFAQRGLLSDIKHVTPERRRGTGGVFKESRRLVRTLLEKEQALKTAETKLTQLRIQAVEQTTRQAIEQITPVVDSPADTGRTAPQTAQPQANTTAVQQTPNNKVAVSLNERISITSPHVSAVQAERIRTTLSNNGIVSFRDLVQKTQADLSSLGLSKPSMDAINNELNHKGLTLAGEADKTAMTQADEGKAPAEKTSAQSQSESPERVAQTQNMSQTEMIQQQRQTVQELQNRYNSAVEKYNSNQGPPNALAEEEIRDMQNKLETAKTQLNELEGQTAEKPKKLNFAERAKAERKLRKQQAQAKQGTARPTPANNQTVQQPAQAEQGATRSTPATNQAVQQPAQAEQGATRSTPANTQTVQQMIEQQENLVRDLQTEANTAKANLRTVMNVKLKNIVYRGGRLMRSLGFLTVGLAGIPVYVAAVGETAIVVFDLPEDMKSLREQYVQDIEEVITSASF